MCVEVLWGRKLLNREIERRLCGWNRDRGSGVGEV